MFARFLFFFSVLIQLISGTDSGFGSGPLSQVTLLLFSLKHHVVTVQWLWEPFVLHRCQVEANYLFLCLCAPVLLSLWGPIWALEEWGYFTLRGRLKSSKMRTLEDMMFSYLKSWDILWQQGQFFGKTEICSWKWRTLAKRRHFWKRIYFGKSDRMHFSRFYTDRHIERHISWRCSLYLVKLVCWCESVPCGSLPDHNRLITDGQTHCVFGRVSVENKLVWMSGRWTCQSILADFKSSSKDRDVLPSMLQSMCTCSVLWNTLNVKLCIYWQKHKLLQFFIHT